MGAVEMDRITRRYRALCELIPLKPITKAAEYDTAVAHLNRLLDAGGANQSHPLAGLVEALGELIHAWERRQPAAPAATPREMLRYLMTEHGLKQSDLAALAAQGTISDVLSGRRAIGKSLAKKLAVRFHVSAGVFL